MDKMYTNNSINEYGDNYNIKNCNFQIYHYIQKYTI